jgi:multiple antibiotic resistance protein
MIETAVSAFIMLFVTIGPFDIAAIFVVLTPRGRGRARRQAALRAVLVAGIVLTLFAFGGIRLLALLQIGLPAFRIAGGILLMLLAVDLLFAHPTGLSSITPREEREAEQTRDIAVFPLAIPLIAGPGSMTAIVLLMGQAAGDLARQGIVLGALAAVLLLTLATLLAAGAVTRALGVTGTNVVARVSGVLLAALAVQFVLDGVRDSGILAASRP